MRATIFGGYKDRSALDLLNQPVRPVHAFNPLVQIESDSPQETRV